MLGGRTGGLEEVQEVRSGGEIEQKWSADTRHLHIDHVSLTGVRRKPEFPEGIVICKGQRNVEEEKGDSSHGRGRRLGRRDGRGGRNG